MPRIIYWFLRFSIQNPLCIRLVGAASRRSRDMYIRWSYVALLSAVLLFGLLGIIASSSFSLRDLAAGSAGVFAFLAVAQLVLICVLTPVFMAGAIAKEAEPKTWDILLITPLSPLQIVLGNLFGRLFFIVALLLGALPLMVVTQFFGGVPLDTILLTQLVAVLLALIVASMAIGMSVTRTAGRKAAVNFFVITVLYLLITYAIDYAMRIPISSGAAATWTTFLTPFNPFLVLEALLQPSGYVIPETSSLPWPLGWLATHPVAGWSWVTLLMSLSIITWSTLQVRKLGDRSARVSFWQRLTQNEIGERESHAVSGNPIAWRERVTRHRNFGSLIGRWGFVSIFGLAFCILTIFYFANTITPNLYRDLLLYMLIGEIVIVTLSAISLSASSIAKEREDGSLDLLLTTSITPKLYLGGKIKGLVMHLLPIVLVPCITMMLVGLIVALNPEGAVVSASWNGANTELGIPPLALYLPALLFPVVFIPYITFCLTLGLLWSMRSKGTISANVSTLVLVFIITAGLNMCLIPVQEVLFMGISFSALSPISNLFAIFTSADWLPKLLEEGLQWSNISMGIATICSGAVWALLSFGLLRSMSTSFVPTVRGLAGIQ